MGIPGASAIPRSLPDIVAGFAISGTSAAIELRRAGHEVVALEQRGPIANRARSISVREQTRTNTLELTGIKLRQNEAIMDIENPLRRSAEQLGTDVHYDHSVIGFDEHPDHVTATVRDTKTGLQYPIVGRTFLDASGGRLAATNSGAFERVATSDSHVYVTAQYRTRAPFANMSGVYDQKRHELLWNYPVGGRDDGFVAYMMLKPGEHVGDEDALRARFDAIAKRCGFGKPISPVQVFDAQQHLSQTASSARMIKVGDSVGNANPLIGAGLAAAQVDGIHAARALTGTQGTLESRLAHAANNSMTAHGQLGVQAQAMVDISHLVNSISARNMPLDEVTKSDLRPMPLFDAGAKFLSSRPVYDGSWHTVGSYLDTAGAAVGGRAGSILGSLYTSADNAASFARDPLGWLVRKNGS